MIVAAVVVGLALGALAPSELASFRLVRIVALLVLILAAVAVWPLVSPADTWPGLAFGLSAVVGAVAINRLERHSLDRRAMQEHEAVSS